MRIGRSIFARLMGVCLCLLAGSSLARDCLPATKSKVANVDASASDRALLCAAVALLNRSAEESFTIRDHSNIVLAANSLRQAGYRSPTTITELTGIAGARGSPDLDMIANVYALSRGCVTPDAVFLDMAEAVKHDGAVAMRMFREMNREGFSMYLALIARVKGCSLS
jgi:hypothetical protein